MSMEHLLLGLVLLFGSLAAGNPLNLKVVEKKVLDMARTSFDDQYLGCSPRMEKELGELNRTEFTNNCDYAEYWTMAADKWQNQEGHVPRPPGMRTEHAVAIMAYTCDGRLYPTFNAAVREAGRSREEYQEKFHFKVLHFLLTQAVKILLEAHPPQCYRVYRGVRDTRFTAQPHAHVRFGQFTSTSFLKSVAEQFGEATFFSVSTCYGVPIRHFSFFPDENEVLIPPYERFVVISITKVGDSNHIELESSGTCSNYNCAWLKGKRRQDQLCDFSADRTIVVDLPAPLGAPPGRHGTGNRGGTLSPDATNATISWRGRRIQAGSHHRHRDGRMGGGRIQGWGHGDNPRAQLKPSHGATRPGMH